MKKIHYVACANHPNDGYTYGWFAWMNNWPDFSSWQIFWRGQGTFMVGTACSS